MAKITPMMQQYFEIKEQYKHCLLFFRLGDFYEMFFEDAVIASKELEITLTGKDWGQEERAPMCGVPFHSADGYIARLVERGYKVAICEQVEDPKTAKGLVKRDVVRVITPGTVVDNTVLDETKNNYILSVFSSANGYGIAVCDVTTGEFQTTEFRSVQAAAKILDETARFSPAELVCNSEFLSTPLAKEIEAFWAPSSLHAARLKQRSNSSVARMVCFPVMISYSWDSSELPIRGKPARKASGL